MDKIIELKIRTQDSDLSEMGIAQDGEERTAYFRADHISSAYPNIDKQSGEPVVSIDMINGEGFSIYEPLEDVIRKWKDAINYKTIHVK